ncbi:ABC transporter ATP-binding protein [uncultured Cytophaga sp.]|uniref:ABC transporter ATP-binding protein n=1 Tax=uncultured Cytophaga sp. TaxID=160238 RepID=UPI002622A750|nr:ABC transporter ATP-binding protein [uncultured Cytophaga sp.]
MNKKENIIECKDLNVSFYIQGHGMGSFKEFLLSLGTKKPFVRKQVLFDINLQIKRGECFGILGRNGSGKSTFLRMLSGIIKPDSGSLTVDGSVAPLLALGVGLEQELSGYENIKLCSSLMRIPAERIKNTIDAIREFSELTHEQLDMQVKRYSSGMISRLGFSIAVSYDPEIFIIDEALSVGDLFFREKCYKRINEIIETGATILFVSQDPKELQKICKRGMILDQGRIKHIGDIGTIQDYYK